MAKVIITIKIMPESVDTNIKKITEEAKNKIIEFAGPGDMKIEEQPIAFGLKAVNIVFVMDESKGSTEPLEESIMEIKGVQSVEITDVRRAIG